MEDVFAGRRRRVDDVKPPVIRERSGSSMAHWTQIIIDAMVMNRRIRREGEPCEPGLESV